MILKAVETKHFVALHKKDQANFTRFGPLTSSAFLQYVAAVAPSRIYHSHSLDHRVTFNLFFWLEGSILNEKSTSNNGLKDLSYWSVLIYSLRSDFSSPEHIGTESIIRIREKSTSILATRFNASRITSSSLSASSSSQSLLSSL